MIEADEGYFSVEVSRIEQDAQKAGSGSVTKSNVMLMAESTVLEDIETSKTERQYHYFKSNVLEDHQEEGTYKVLKEAIDGEKSIVFSDRSTSYINIKDYVEIHIIEKSNQQTTKESLKWVYIAIRNAKTDLQKFHKIKRKYLQLYLKMSSFISSIEDILEIEYLIG